MKTKGLIQVYTGDGKGKTTAAFGVALRMIGCGQKVGVVQFFKHPAKSKAPDREGAFRAFSKFKSQFRVWSFGKGFTWCVAKEVNDVVAAQAWKQSRKLLRDSRYSLVILDEIHIALEYKFLKVSELLKALHERPVTQHVILTGRGAPAKLIQAADLVTEMKCVRHPFRKGILAQRGIEY